MLTEDQRKTLINELYEIYVDGCDLGDMILHGCRGLNDMTDEELLEELSSLACFDEEYDTEDDLYKFVKECELQLAVNEELTKE